ncbi:chromosome partitioning protein [Salinibacter ruber]|uniref:ParA family partition ATPase n=1 Tax=Salinibacter ruber TaxID=146919 RepID=UPI0021693702|nr:ParA family partition ATPase [Salinibacter ruber]MCS3940238.1 chromosome partitioning protein [Salinibacter ruber]
MHVVSTVHSKGGCGKSTIAINLARTLQLRGLDVAVLDTDKQSTAQNWRASGSDELLPVFGVEKPTNLESTSQGLVDAFDVAVIDGGAHLQEMHAAIIKESNLVLIPIQPSPGDIWPTETIVELIKTRQKVAGSPEAAFVINRRKQGTRLGKATEEALRQFELPVWNGTVDRVAYAEALGNGISVVESSDDKAAAEVESITDNVIETLSTNGRR